MSKAAAYERAMRRYAERRLAMPGPFELVKPDTGVNTFVRLLKNDRQEFQYVLRAFSPISNGRVRRRMRIDEMMREHGLACPKIVGAALGIPFLRPAILAEEYLNGRHLQKGEWTEDRVRTLADTLAAYHKVHSARHGDVMRPSMRSFANVWRQRIRNRMQEARLGGGSGFDASIVESAGQWLFTWSVKLDGITRFDLIHDKLNMGNVIVLEPPPRVALLDFETLQYGSRVKDLVQTKYDVLFNNSEAWKALLTQYEKHFSREQMDEVKELTPFFEIYYHLSAVAAVIKRRTRHKDSSKFGPRFLRHLEALRNLSEK